VLGVGLSAIEPSVPKLPVPTLRCQCTGTQQPLLQFSRPSSRTRRKGYAALTTGLLIIALILYAESFAYK
jgi:hypothetical protein